MKNNIGKIFLRKEKLPRGGCVYFYVTQAIAVGDCIQGVADFKDGTCQIDYINEEGVYAFGQMSGGDVDILLKIGELMHQ